MHRNALLAVLLAGCTGQDTDETAAPDGPPACGDGVTDADEACDDGEANDDAAPDACRTDCSLPACGDGVTDAGESCDDGEAWGGDGCDAACALEVGSSEVEPNDAWSSANPAGQPGNGALPEGDVDCWSVDLPSCGAVSALQTGDCAPSMTLALHDPDGALVAVGAPGADGCAILDPADQPGARWVRSSGAWSVCAEAVNGAEIRGYSLAVEAVDPLSLGILEADDPDGDGVPNHCDPDRDGDGVPDGDDNCPDVSNGPDTTALSLSPKGYVRTWLAAGPFTTGVTSGTCRPSEDAFVGEPVVTATVGDPAGVNTWAAAFPSSDVYDFNVPWGSVAAPREAYVLVYLQSATARSLTLAVGSDDGVFAWWNGELVLDVPDCTGVNADQFKADVDVVAGTNTLLLKIYDQGGGWGIMARLLDSAGNGVTDLVPTLAPDGSGWLPDQTDSDADGLGDVCDPTP
jgi:cysteine-rich repeat protein